jgi:hypothetical protein
MEKFMAEGAHARVTSHSGNEGRSNRTVTMNIDCGDASVVIQQQIAVSDDLVSQGIRRLEKMVDVFRDVTDSSRAKSMIGKLQIWLTEDEDQKMPLQQRAQSRPAQFSLPGEELVGDLAEVKEAYVKLYGGGPQTPPAEVRHLQQRMIYDMLRWNKQPHEKAESIVAMKLEELKSEAEVWVFLGAKYSSIGLTFAKLSESGQVKQTATVDVFV